MIDSDSRHPYDPGDDDRLYSDLLEQIEAPPPVPKISCWLSTDPDYASVLLIGGSSHPRFVEGLAGHMSFEQVAAEDARHPNQEVRTRIGANMRDMKVIGIQSPHGQFVDAHFQELCTIASAARSHWATYQGIFAVIPNFAYGRQDRESFGERETPTGATMMRRLQAEGVHSMMVMDMHNDAVAGAFTGPCERLAGSFFMVKYLQSRFQDINPLIVSPDAGGMKRSAQYADFMGTTILNADKLRAESGSFSGSIRMAGLNGSVAGRDCIVPDDILSTGGTLTKVAELLKEHGANSVIAVATHGEFARSGRATVYRSPYLDHVVVSDTLPQHEAILAAAGMDDKISVVPMTGVFSEAIKIVLHGRTRSMRELYQMSAEQLKLTV